MRRFLAVALTHHSAFSAQKTEILWDTFGVPHIYARQPGIDVLCPRLGANAQSGRSAAAPLW